MTLFIFYIFYVQMQEYQELIKDPINFSLLQTRIRSGDYYRNREMLFADLILMVRVSYQNYDCNIYIQSLLFE